MCQSLRRPFPLGITTPQGWYHPTGLAVPIPVWAGPPRAGTGLQGTFLPHCFPQGMSLKSSTTAAIRGGGEGN